MFSKSASSFFSRVGHRKSVVKSENFGFATEQKLLLFVQHNRVSLKDTSSNCKYLPIKEKASKTSDYY